MCSFEGTTLYRSARVSDCIRWLDSHGYSEYMLLLDGEAGPDLPLVMIRKKEPEEWQH